MVSSSWANDKAVWHLDYWWKCAELDCDKLNFLEIKFDLVVVEVEIFKIVDSSASADLFFDILLNWGDMCEPEVVGMTK
jgi:hypothetical protein